MDEVLAVHRGWFESNIDLDIDAMLAYFPAGDGYLQFNLNGMTYRGAADKAKLWRGLKAVGANITGIKDVEEPWVQIFGDVALVTSECEVELELPGGTGRLQSSGPMRIRSTEFQRRDDGAGGTDWRIWHMHISEAAPDGALRYGNE
jgi:ketosteroid isomerase-like protein